MKTRPQPATIRQPDDPVRARPESDDGFMLLGLIVAIAIILITLSVAAARVAKELHRDRELEAVHRGNQYVRAIQLYYRKFGHYPGTIEQLEKTNNIRFLRQRYFDPMTGKDDWRLIPVGGNNTTVKGFFGLPLAGIASTGVGSVAGMMSSGIGQAAAGAGAGPAAGATGGVGIGGASPTSGNAAPTSGNAAAPSGTGTSTSTGGSTGISSQSATGFSGGGVAFMGVGLGTAGDSIVEINEQTTYDTWEFLYDPRVELLKAKAGLNGGGLGSVGAGSLGQTPGSIGAPATPGTPATGAPAPGATGPGTITQPSSAAPTPQP